MTGLTYDGAAPGWTLTDRLRKAREHADMEQLELAESIGLSRATVSGYERGATLPKRPVLVAWAMVTGVSLEWIEGGEEEVELPRVDSNHQPAGYMPTAA